MNATASWLSNCPARVIGHVKKNNKNVKLLQSPDLYHAAMVCFDTFIHMLKVPCELSDGGAS